MIGGMTNSAICGKVIAEMLGKDIKVINGVNAGAVGSAILAGVGVGALESSKKAFQAMSFPEKKIYA